MRTAPGTHGPPGSQRGAALIALVLALALGSGLVTIEWLEAAARSAHAARRTEAALAAARDALIGYAVSYPDQHSGRHGPGYLPCPDTSGNGSPNTPCARKSLGRLPWRRLGLHDPRDGAGERLWYALADNFRANGYKHRPLNRETAAGLVLDGRTGVAAVIAAPGPPLPFQDRARDRFDPARYLEGGNETPHDAAYTTRGSPPGPSAPPGATFDRFNDRVVAISRDDLMAAAGRRVLAEVRALLREYRGAPWNTGVLPWLAPWNGAAEGVLPVPGTIAGRLSLAPVGAALTTSFRVTGSPAGGSVSASGTVDAAVLARAGRRASRAGRAVHLDGRLPGRLHRREPGLSRTRPGARVPVRPAPRGRCHGRAPRTRRHPAARGAGGRMGRGLVRRGPRPRRRRGDRTRPDRVRRRSAPGVAGRGRGRVSVRGWRRGAGVADREVDTGEVIHAGTRHRIVWLGEGDGKRLSVLKRTRAGEIYLQSYRGTNADDIARLSKKRG